LESVLDPRSAVRGARSPRHPSQRASQAQQTAQQTEGSSQRGKPLRGRVQRQESHSCVTGNKTWPAYQNRRPVARNRKPLTRSGFQNRPRCSFCALDGAIEVPKGRHPSIDYPRRRRPFIVASGWLENPPEAPAFRALLSLRARLALLAWPAQAERWVSWIPRLLALTSLHALQALPSRTSRAEGGARPRSLASLARSALS
jgi:hypothetical protein